MKGYSPVNGDEILSDLRHVVDLLDAAPSCRESVMNVSVDRHGILINAAGAEQTARHWAHTFGVALRPMVEIVEMEKPTRQVAIRVIDSDDLSIRVIEDPMRPAARTLKAVKP